MAVAEVLLAPLEQHAQLFPQYRELISYPAISQDLNVIVAESVRWADVDATVREAAAEVLESITYRETYRDAKADGAGTKRVLMTVTIRSPQGTLTMDEANAIRDRMVSLLGERTGGVLVE